MQATQSQLYFYASSYASKGAMHVDLVYSGGILSNFERVGDEAASSYVVRRYLTSNIAWASRLRSDLYLEHLDSDYSGMPTFGPRS